MTLIDPIKLVVEILTELGHNEVHSDYLEARAVSSAEYIFVRELPGLVPHIRYSDRPSIELLVYSNKGFDESRRISYLILSELQNAQGLTYTSGGIHRVITVLRPSRQDVVGLPPGVGRTVAQLDLVLSNLEKWELA